MTYAFKFVWAPLVDRVPLPLLDRWLGRRRGWMLLAQIGIVLSAARAWRSAIPRTRPGRPRRAALAVAFFSATQDIALDAFRIEILRDEEQGAGSATTSSATASRSGSSTPWRCCCRASLPWPVVLLA